MSDATITVTQVRSSIGTKPKQRGTLRALVQLVEEMSDEPQALELTDVATGTAGAL